MNRITCHCGNVNLAFEKLPTQVRDCDCPICNRLGALWADFSVGDVSIEMQTDTSTYRWGDEQYEMHHCTICGCTTHYTDVKTGLELGINFRMFDRKRLEKIPVAK